MNSECVRKIRELSRLVTAFESDLQQRMGLNLNEAALLCLLSEQPNPMLAGEIADEMGMTRSNASKVIAALERNSLIRRRACSEDGRCQRFHITKHGLEKLAQVHCDSIVVPDELKGII